MIHIVDSARFRVNRSLVKTVVKEYLAKCGAPPTLAVNVIFVGKRKMLYIATVYKREPEALPVLTFSYKTTKKMMHSARQIDGDTIGEIAHHVTLPTMEYEDNLLGEIFICFPQAVLLAAERNKKVDDILTFLIQHGIDNLIKSSRDTVQFSRTV